MYPPPFPSRWSQEEVGVPLGVLTEGSIEVCNKDVKKANRCFVARVSSECIQRDIMVRRSWEADPLLHYEMTVRQVLLNIPQLYSLLVHLFLCLMCLPQVIRRGNIYKKRKKTDEDEDAGEEEVNGNGELDLVAVFGEEEERMAMVADMEEEGWGGDNEIFMEEEED